MPVFALANTGIVIGGDWIASLATPNSKGIIFGLLFGKVVGVTLASFICVKIGICKLPIYLEWKHVIGAGFLAGIGFTMSIFITNLAFKSLPEADVLTNSSKMAILLTSLVSGAIGYIWLYSLSKISRSHVRADMVSYETEDD